MGFWGLGHGSAAPKVRALASPHRGLGLAFFCLFLLIVSYFCLRAVAHWWAPLRRCRPSGDLDGAYPYPYCRTHPSHSPPTTLSLRRPYMKEQHKARATTLKDYDLLSKGYETQGSGLEPETIPTLASELGRYPFLCYSFR